MGQKESQDQEKKYLKSLQEFSKSEYYKAYLWLMGQGYEGADSLLHSINQDNKDY